jgi:cytochrome c-type biogenesis protein CcmE
MDLSPDEGPADAATGPVDSSAAGSAQAIGSAIGSVQASTGSGDGSAMDLRPRNQAGRAQGATTGARKKRKWGPYLVLGLVLVGGAVVVGKGLTSAIDYYCNADEIGVVDKCSGDRNVRVQGAVDDGSIVEGSTGTVDAFTITFNGQTIPVDYSQAAAVPGLFQACIPVIVAGALQPDGTLLATGVEVKHSDEYEKKNADRIDNASSAACAQRAALEAEALNAEAETAA